MKKDNLYIIMPAYNEQDTIGEVVDEWYNVVNKIGEDSRLVVINDGSKDDTLKILKELQNDKPQLVVLDKKNSGHGSTVIYGYNYAISKNPAYVFQTDSDGQTLASEFWQFWDHRNEYDAQFGFRKKREDGLSRWIVTKTLRFIVWGIFKTWVTDANTPYRLMKTSVLEETLKYLDLHKSFLDWFYDNSLNEETKKLIENFDRTKETIERLWYLTNQEFCRVRTSNYRYKTGGDNGEIYFRISSENFNWFDLI